MRKKLVMSLVLIAAVAAFLTGGAVASFLDVDSSSDNSFQAGTLDLKTDDADGVTRTLYATDMKPGDILGPSTIVLRNVGSIDGSSMDINVSYTESDDTANAVNMTADQTAAVLEVSTLEYYGFSLLGGVSDGNSNTYIDMEDLLNTDLTGQTGLSASDTASFVIQLTLTNSISNDFQGDGIDISITFTLNQ